MKASPPTAPPMIAPRFGGRLWGIYVETVGRGVSVLVDMLPARSVARLEVSRLMMVKVLGRLIIVAARLVPECPRRMMVSLIDQISLSLASRGSLAAKWCSQIQRHIARLLSCHCFGRSIPATLLWNVPSYRIRHDPSLTKERL